MIKLLTLKWNILKNPEKNPWWLHFGLQQKTNVISQDYHKHQVDYLHSDYNKNCKDFSFKMSGNFDIEKKYHGKSEISIINSCCGKK